MHTTIVMVYAYRHVWKRVWFDVRPHPHVPWYCKSLDIPELALAVAHLNGDALRHVAVVIGADRDGQLLHKHTS